ncbi:MAG TPA: response regulator, partial [Segetibacter sp.]|nr:response regulator [Segetibacter sp.]
MAVYKHIILADDDTDDIELFQSAAKECNENIEIVTAKDGIKLIELLEKEERIDVIILDLNMPKMNGYECVKTIRQNKKYNTIPIMIFSTSSAKEDIEYCFETGAEFYVVKPASFK